MTDMDHLTDQRLGRYLDGELSDIERSRAERHLEECERCRSELARLHEASEQLNGLIEEVKLPERLREADVYPPKRRERGETSGPTFPLRAATAAAVLLLGVSAAVPGSPVRSWLAGAADRVRAALQAGEESAAGAEPGFGLQIRPADGQVRVDIRGAAPGTPVAVRMVEDSLAGAWAPGARLRSEPGRLEVVDPDRGEVRINVPRRARRAQVTADSRTIFRWKHGRVEVPRAVTPDSGGVLYRFRLDSARTR